MIKEFTDLHAWQASKDVVVATYRITRAFPKDELYALTSQMRRASTSATANIAEGFARSTSKDREHFYIMAVSSLVELKSHAIIAYELDYIDATLLEEFCDCQATAAKLIRGLLRAHRRPL